MPMSGDADLYCWPGQKVSHLKNMVHGLVSVYLRLFFCSFVVNKKQVEFREKG